MVYELSFYYYDDDPDNDEDVYIATYSSYKLAEKAITKFAQQPRFKGKEDAFFIGEHKINEEYEFWREGFVTEYYDD